MNRSRISHTGADLMNVGKIPPNVVEMEETVLGALLLEPFHISTISSILKPEYFYNEHHVRIYKAILSLYTKGTTIDILTVTAELKKSEELEIVGGAYYVSSLTNRIASSANIEVHARYIHEKHILREIILLGIQITSNAYEPSADPFEIIDQINKRTTALTNIMSNKIKVVGDHFNEMINEISDVIEHGLPTGMMSGIDNLDKQTGGWQKGHLIVTAARPGMGKTALALALAKHPAIELKKPVAIFSLEMTARELTGRLAASESDISATKITQKSINRLELQTMGGRCFKLVDAPIYIDDTTALRFSDLKAKAKKLKYENGIELIIIDYLQLMHGEEKGNREQEIAYITRNLKALAKELDLPIIALSQLSRKVEERERGENAKRPQLSDLRESGAIEADADIVLFIFRPEYYGLFENGYGFADKVLDTKGLMLLDIAKGRGIHLCEVPAKFYGEFMKILNYDLSPTQLIDATAPLENNTDFLNIAKNDIEDF